MRLGRTKPSLATPFGEGAWCKEKTSPRLDSRELKTAENSRALCKRCSEVKRVLRRLGDDDLWHDERE